MGMWHIKHIEAPPLWQVLSIDKNAYMFDFYRFIVF